MTQAPGLPRGPSSAVIWGQRHQCATASVLQLPSNLAAVFLCDQTEGERGGVWWLSLVYQTLSCASGLCSGLVQTAVVQGEFAKDKFGSRGWGWWVRFSEMGKRLEEISISDAIPSTTARKTRADLGANLGFSTSAALKYIHRLLDPRTRWLV